MKSVQMLAAMGAMASVAQAHMEMVWPPPFRSKANPNAGQDIDYSMTSPLSADGSDFPCKGYQKVLGTDAGKSVAEWTPGQKYNLTLSGSATHGGGSCQASMSYDKAKTWTAIHSYIGNCPSGPVSLEFTLPDDTPAGDAVFAWTWNNKIGNREMYMNCASVTVAGGGSKARDVDGEESLEARDASDSYDSRPAMFVANVNNGCTAVEGKDVEYPDPGPDVTRDSSNTGPPEGNCGSSSGGGGGGGGGDDGGSDGGSGGGDASTTAAPDTPAPTTSVYVLPSKPLSKTTSSSVFSPGGIFITATDSSSDTPAPPATSSTLATVTTPASPPSTPEPSPGGGSGGGSGGYAQGTACTTEGEWNCVGGNQFQRCASGVWSSLTPMAGGTNCQSGQSSSLNMFRARDGARMYNAPWKV